ncbi:hypothetical protein ABZP36_008886 [Zizania latifolia]
MRSQIRSNLPMPLPLVDRVPYHRFRAVKHHHTLINKKMEKEDNIHANRAGAYTDTWRAEAAPGGAARGGAGLHRAERRGPSQSRPAWGRADGTALGRAAQGGAERPGAGRHRTGRRAVGRGRAEGGGAGQCRSWGGGRAEATPGEAALGGVAQDGRA